MKTTVDYLVLETSLNTWSSESLAKSHEKLRNAINERAQAGYRIVSTETIRDRVLVFMLLEKVDQ